MVNNTIQNLKGFTLIEVMVSLLLFTIISLSMTNVIDQTTRAQDQIENLIKKNRIIKNISYVIKQDIQTLVRAKSTSHWAYRSYVNLLRAESQDDFLDEYFSREELSFLYSTNFPTTGFLGRQDSFYLTRKSQNQAITKTGYRLEPCENSDAHQCLVREVVPLDNLNIKNPFTFSMNDLEESFSTFNSELSQKSILMEGVQSINLQYLSVNETEWTEEFHFSYREGIYIPPPLPLAIKFNILFVAKSKPPLELYIPLYQSFISNKIQMPSTVARPNIERKKDETNNKDKSTRERKS